MDTSRRSALREIWKRALVLACFFFPTMLSAQWSALSLIDTTTANLLYQHQASIDVNSDGMLGVAWQEQTSDRRDPIIFMSSTDRGTTFSRHIVIDSVLRQHTWFEPGEARAIHGMKISPNGTIWVLWSYYLIYDFYDEAYLRLSKSTDGGDSFLHVFEAPRASLSFLPQLAVAKDGSVSVLWDSLQFTCTTFPHGEIALRKDARIPAMGYVIEPYAALTVDSANNVYAAWSGSRYDTSYHYFLMQAVSHDGGATFPVSVQLDSSLGPEEPVLAMGNDGDEFILYREFSGYVPGSPIFDVFLLVSHDEGQSFGSPTLLASSVDESGSIDIAFQKRIGVLLTWTSHAAIHYAKSTDEGISFSQFGTVDSTTPAGSQRVALDSSGSAFVVANISMRGGSAAAVSFSMAQLLTSVGGDSKPAVPFRFTLAQNYPNPFNPSTTISYTLPTQGFVTLKVFNVLGQEVAILVNGIENLGYKSVWFDGSGLPSGTYFYRLQAGSYAETKLLMIVK